MYNKLRGTVKVRELVFNFYDVLLYKLFGVELILQKLYRATKLSSHFRIELREELNGNLFQKLLVLSLSLEKKPSMAFLCEGVKSRWEKPLEVEILNSDSYSNIFSRTCPL